MSNNTSEQTNAQGEQSIKLAESSRKKWSERATILAFLFDVVDKVGVVKILVGLVITASGGGYLVSNSLSHKHQQAESKQPISSGSVPARTDAGKQATPPEPAPVTPPSRTVPPSPPPSPDLHKENE